MKMVILENIANPYVRKESMVEIVQTTAPVRMGLRVLIRLVIAFVNQVGQVLIAIYPAHLDCMGVSAKTNASV